ncbi:MAG: hypothetical protein LBV19_03150 [Streptococcaceae bacterium]|nr:hypothetical protein [Streptococcaceae bacterium]
MAKSQLIKDIATNKITLEEGLQRLLVISYSLENESLQAWIASELNGYPDIKKLPGYRKKISNKIFYTGINGSYKVTNVPLPTNFIPEELRDVLEETCILDGVKSIEETIQTDSKVGRDLTDMAGFIYQKVGVTCVSIIQEYSISSYQKVISNVKNKLILILLDLEKAFGNLDNLDIDVEKISFPEITTLNSAIENRIYFDGTSEEI